MAQSNSMKPIQTKSSQFSTLFQLLITFVIPIIILSYFSKDSQLGAAKGFLLALAFPVAYEAYGLLKHRRPNIISLLAIGGILVTGAISLFKLNEDWLAVRRALPYLAVALVFLVSDLIKRPVFNIVLPHVLDMDKVSKNARANKSLPNLLQAVKQAGLFASLLLVVVSVITFVLTKVIIVSATNTTAFNQEYARLRLISLPAVTLPLFAGGTLILYYLVSAIEKFTGLKFEEILKKKQK
jgi:hypothetical protein